MNTERQNHKRRRFSFVLLAGVLLLSGCRSSKAPVGAPLERVTEWNENPKYGLNPGTTLKTWLDSDTPTSAVNTPENRWANGYAECMNPFVVDWQRSELSDSEGDYVVVHNVQVSGNPLLGTSRNATVRIPTHGIERVEYLVVRYSLKGIAKAGGHVQLRFVFKKDRRPELFDNTGKPDLMQPYLDDLIVSWEAWRPSNTKWQFIAGLEPENYALTARMYSGSQRFLNDSLRGAVWDCYPLLLPDHPDSEDMVLYSCLMMGDAMTRTTLAKMIGEELVAAHGEDYVSQYSKREVAQARKRLAWEGIPDTWFKEEMANADLSYNSLERSCITVALLQIELAMDWLYEDNNLGLRKEIAWAPPGEIPAWFTDKAASEKVGGFFAAPGALFWALRNKEIFPYKSYLPLKDADMLQTDKKGRIIMYRYGHKLGSPYGELSRNLM